MCPRGRPRGQGRPRGLHLCLFAKINFICLTLHHWQKLVLKFRDIRKGRLCKIRNNKAVFDDQTLCFLFSNKFCKLAISRGISYAMFDILQEILQSHPFLIVTKF